MIEKVKGINFAFIALHGSFGEDRTIQGLLEALKIPYSGCGVLTSAVYMNKGMIKRRIYRQHLMKCLKRFGGY